MNSILSQKFSRHIYPTITLLSASLVVTPEVTSTTTMISPLSHLTMTSVTQCERKKKDDDESILSKVKDMALGGDNIDWNKQMDLLGQELGSKVQGIVDSGLPTHISYGFICGFSSGYCLKKVGKLLSVVVGFGFMTLQTLSYSGYITVDHSKLKEKVENVLDLNNDGKVNKKDANLALDKVKEVLTYNMPGGSGFVAGFLCGFRSR